MIRRLIYVHTAVLACAAVALLAAPAVVLASLGVSEASLGVLSLTRVIAALLMIVAAAALPLASLNPGAREGALRTLGIAYAIGALLLLAQEIAIWNTLGGAVVGAATAVLASGFIGATVTERRHRVAGA